MKKVTIIYLLSEEGRKKSLLAGGDGCENQKIFADITPETLNVATVDSNGNVILDLAGWLPIDVKLENTDSATWRWYGNKPKLISITPSNSGRKYFDEPQTVQSLIDWEKARATHIARKKAELQPELDRLLSEYEAKMAAEKAKKEVEEAQRQAERAAREEAAAAEKAKWEADKTAWVSDFGSDYLKDAMALGYNCQRRYVTERAAMEFPGFMVDFDERAGWQDRVCPSEEALSEIKKLIKFGHDAQIVWLTCGPEEPDYEAYKEEIEPCEAIVIRKYLGKYDLIKF